MHQRHRYPELSDRAYYLSIISPDSFSWTNEELVIKDTLKSLNLFNVKQQMPMVLSLIRAYRNKKITLRMTISNLKKIELFHFIFNAITSQRSSGSIQTLYSKHAIILTNTEDHSEIQSNLKEMALGLKNKLPTYIEFEANFIELIYTSKKTKNKSIIRYILKKSLGENPSGMAVNFDNMSIEHILSEDNSKKGQDLEIIGHIGNLLLVDRKTNSENLNNLSFMKKKEILQRIGYPLDEIIKESNEWDIEKINMRAKFIAKKLYDISILK